MQLARIFSPYSRRTAELSKLDPCGSTYDRLRNQHFASGDHHDGARLWRRSTLSQSCRHWAHFEDYRCVLFMSHVTLGDQCVIFSLNHIRLCDKYQAQALSPSQSKPHSARAQATACILKRRCIQKRGPNTTQHLSDTNFSAISVALNIGP